MGQWDEWIYLQWLTNSTSHKLVISPITLQIKRYIYFRSKNIFLIMHENSALMSHGRAVQSSLQGVSGCIVPAGMASGEDMLRTNQTLNCHTCIPFVHWQCIRHRAILQSADCHITSGDMKSCFARQISKLTCEDVTMAMLSVELSKPVGTLSVRLDSLAW